MASGAKLVEQSSDEAVTLPLSAQDENSLREAEGKEQEQRGRAAFPPGNPLRAPAACSQAAGGGMLPQGSPPSQQGFGQQQQPEQQQQQQAATPRGRGAGARAQSQELTPQVAELLRKERRRLNNQASARRKRERQEQEMKAATARLEQLRCSEAKLALYVAQSEAYNAHLGREVKRLRGDLAQSFATAAELEGEVQQLRASLTKCRVPLPERPTYSMISPSSSLASSLQTLQAGFSSAEPSTSSGPATGPHLPGGPPGGHSSKSPPGTPTAAAALPPLHRPRPVPAATGAPPGGVAMMQPPGDAARRPPPGPPPPPPTGQAGSPPSARVRSFRKRVSKASS